MGAPQPARGAPSATWPRYPPFLVPLALSATLLFFVPSTLFIGNVREFAFLWRHHAIYWALATLAVAAALCTLNVLTRRVRPGACERMIALVSAVSVLVWIQAYLLVRDYGVLDGKPMDWSRHALAGLLDAALWIAGCTVAWRWSRLVARAAPIAALFLLVVQGVSTAWSVLAELDEEHFRWRVDQAEAFRFSPEQNAILIVLDAVQADLAAEVLADNPRLMNELDGFTFFRNAVGGFPITMPSVAVILSGQEYDGEEPFVRFLDRTYRGPTVMERARRGGFRADVWTNYALAAVMPNVPRLFDNVIPTRPPLAVGLAPLAAEHVLLGHLALFRATPHPLKSLVWSVAPPRDYGVALATDGTHPTAADDEPVTAASPFGEPPSLRDSSNEGFVAAMTAMARIDADQPTFKYFHLRGAHLPWRASDDGEAVDLQVNRDNGKTATLAALNNAAEVLGQLKRINAYDNSTILLISDHGLATAEVGVVAGANTPDPPQAAWYTVPQWKGAALPLVLVKPASARGPLRVSDTPSAHIDLPTTLLELAGLDSSGFPGRNLFSTDDDPARPRVYRELYYVDIKNRTLSPPVSFVAAGFAWHDTAWRRGDGALEQPPSTAALAGLSRDPRIRASGVEAPPYAEAPRVTPLSDGVVLRFPQRDLARGDRLRISLQLTDLTPLAVHVLRGELLRADDNAAIGNKFVRTITLGDQELLRRAVIPTPSAAWHPFTLTFLPEAREALLAIELVVEGTPEPWQWGRVIKLGARELTVARDRTPGFLQPRDLANRILRAAVTNRDLDRLSAALAAGADPDTPFDGGTALTHAARTAWAPASASLLAARASPDRADEHGDTPLIHAARQRAPDVVALLLQHGAEVDRAGLSGERPLTYAVTRGCLDCAAALLAAGATLNTADRYGRTPLMRAAERGDRATVELLLAHGAKWRRRDAAGRQAWQIAAAAGHEEIAALLRQGAPPQPRR